MEHVNLEERVKHLSENMSVEEFKSMSPDQVLLNDLVGKQFNEKAIENITKEVSTDQFDVTPGRWAVSGSGTVYYACEDTADKVAPGAYFASYSMSIGPYLRKLDIKTDDLLTLPDDASGIVLEHIKEFWHLKEKFDEFGYLHKRGILLFGPPGSGKTSTVVQTIKNIVSEGGVAIYTDYPPEAVSNMRILRRIEPDRQVVIILEDIDTIVYRYGDRTLTSMLDGEANIDNVLFIATTNYPERLPARLVNRPSRFDVVQYIGMPNAEARKMYLRDRVGDSLAPSHLDSWVQKTDGLSIAHLKEIIILHFVYGKNIDEAIERMSKGFRIPSSHDFARDY